MLKSGLQKGNRPQRFQRKPSVSVCDAAGPSVAVVRVAAAPFVAVCVTEGSLHKRDMLSRIHRRHSGAVRAAGEPCVAVRAVGKPVVAVRAVGEPVVAVRILAAGVVEFEAHDIMGFGLSPLYPSALSRSSSSETGAQARDMSHITWRGYVSSVTVANSRWNSGSFLQGDVSFNFFGPMRVEVTGIYMDFTIGVMILLGQRMEKFFNLAFAGANVHTGDVYWVYQ